MKRKRVRSPVVPRRDIAAAWDRLLAACVALETYVDTVRFEREYEAEMARICAKGPPAR